MSEKLKPCPFCGGEAIAKKDADKNRYNWYVTCSYATWDCPCMPSTGYYDTKKHAIEAWNRRAKDE